MTSLLNRWIPSLTLATWSAVLLATSFTGRVNAFLHPSFRPGILIAGFALAALSLLIGSRPTPPECCQNATCTHPLSRSLSGRWLTFLILVLPVSVAAWLSPEHFSKQLIENRGISMDATGLAERPANALSRSASPAPNPLPPSPPLASSLPEPVPSSPQAAPAASPSQKPQSFPNPQQLPEYMQRSPEGYIVAEILDLLYSVQDSQLRKDFEGKTIQLIAQTMPDKTSASGTPPPGGPSRFKAVRMFMTCCAADARPVATLVQTSAPLDIPEMSWVKIIGKATFPVENGKRISVLEATSVQPTKPPEESMLFQ